MSYNDSFTTRWTSSDFTKHGYIATYALGKCRCSKCTDRWLAWNELAGMKHQRQVMRQATKRSQVNHNGRRA